MSPNRIAAHFKTLDLGDVPHSRAGKHKKIVSMILRDLDQLKDGAALRVPLDELGNTKENVRSALNRATRNAKRNVATATDENGNLKNVAGLYLLGWQLDSQGNIPTNTSALSMINVSSLAGKACPRASRTCRSP